MNAQELRCPGCFAPIAVTQAAISKCRYCGATLAIQGAVPDVALPPHDPGYVPVFLEDAGDDKISVIKVIREFTGFGLREAKDLCERAPCIVFNWPGEPTKTRDFRLALARAGARVR